MLHGRCYLQLYNVRNLRIILEISKTPTQWDKALNNTNVMLNRTLVMDTMIKIVISLM